MKKELMLCDKNLSSVLSPLLFSRRSCLLFFRHSALKPVTSLVLASWQSCDFILATLISNCFRKEICDYEKRNLPF